VYVGVGAYLSVLWIQPGVGVQPGTKDIKAQEKEGVADCKTLWERGALGLRGR